MKQFKLHFFALLALLCSVSFSVNAVVNVGDTITMDGIVFKVPAAGTNLIANPGFEDGLTSAWTSGTGAAITATEFTVKDTGGVSNSKYLVGTANTLVNTVGALRTLWPLQLGKGYLLSYYCRFQDTSKVTATDANLKVSQTNAAGTESLVLLANSSAGGKNVWALNQTTFTGKYNSVQVHFRSLNSLFGFDSFSLIKLDSIGLDLTTLKTAITTAQTYVASSYPGIATLNAAIAAAQTAQTTVTSIAGVATAANTLNMAVRAYRLTQSVAPGDSLNFSFAITNPGMDASSNSVLPTGWNIIATNGNGYTGTSQHYSGVTTNRYMDSWNGTAGALIYVAQQKITGLPKGTYRVSAAARASGTGVYVTGNDRQTGVPVNNDVGGTLGPTLKGWNLVKVDSIINVSDAVTIGAKTTVGWLGSWFSADDFTLTYFGEKVADYQKYMATVATSVRAIDLSTVPNGVDALITASLAKSDTASTVTSVLTVTNQLIAARDSATNAVAPYASLKVLIVSAGVVDTTYAGLATLRTAITAANTLVGSATAMRPEILAGIKTLNTAMLAYQYTKPASATSPADFTFAIANASFELGSTTGWTTSTGASDNGAKLNSNATYTMSGADGLYVFNIWGGSTLPFVIKQELTGLPKGTYKLIATVATDTLNTIKLFANGTFKNLSPNNKGKGLTDTLGIVTVADGKLTIGAQSQTWFKADNFRLLYYPPVSYTSSIVNPGIDAADGNVVPNGWSITKNTGGYTNTGQHYSGVGTNRYLDSWHGTTGYLIYNAQQTVKSIPNGIYSVSAAARTSGLKSYIYANDNQTEIINNGGANGTLGNGFSIISVDKAVVMDSSITIGAKTVTGWTGQWFSADDFTLSYNGPGDFASYKPVMDSLIAKSKRFDLTTSPDGQDALLATAITTAEAATDEATILAAYSALKKAYDNNVASVAPLTKLKALVTSCTTVSTTTSYTGLAILTTAITAADDVAKAATTLTTDVITATTVLNKALYDYKVMQPAPADFTFAIANPSFEDVFNAGVDPASIKPNVGNAVTPNGWNVLANIDVTAGGMNLNSASGSSMADGNWGYETWCSGGKFKSANVSQKIVAPSTGYYTLTGKLRCDGSSPSLTDPLKYDAQVYAKVGNAAEVKSIKLAEAPGFISGSGWNTKAAWRTMTVYFKANAGDTIKLGAQSTSFMQMDNFTLSFQGNNNPAIIDVAYIAFVKTMDATADSVKNDPIYRMLSRDPKLNVVMHALTDVSATATFDQSPYDALVIQESFSSTAAILKPGGALSLSMLAVPTLMNKTYTFKAGGAFATGATGAGVEANPGVFSIKVDTANWTNPLFKGIPIIGDTIQLFTKAAQDLGIPPTTVLTTNKALNYAKDVVGTEGTLLAYPLGISIAKISINNVVAPDTFGGQPIKTRMILLGQNFGALCRDHGKNITNANYTLWRNAVYSLAGLPIPETGVGLPAVVNISGSPVPAFNVLVVDSTATNNTVKIGGYNLSGDIKLALSGAGASMYKLSYDSLISVAGATKDSLLTISYKPTAAGVHVAKLTISTLNFPDYVINLSGSAMKDVTSWIVNPGIDAADGAVQPNGWNVIKGTGNSNTNTGQHYSGVATNRYLDSWNGTTGSMIYTATQVVKSIPNGIYNLSAAARTSGLGSYIFGNDKQTEIINNGGGGGTLGNGFNTIKVDRVVVLDSTISIGAKTVIGWTGQWFSADDFKMAYFGPGEFADFKVVLDSLIAKAKRFDLNTSPNGLDGALTAGITTAVAANDVATVMSSYKGLKNALDNNVASVPMFTKLTTLIASSTVLSNTTNFNGLAALKTAITVAETVANGATTMPINVDSAIVNLNKALYNYKVTQPAPADFTFIMANPSFEEGTVAGIDPASVKKNGGFNTPNGWNVYAVIDTLAPGANFVNISGASMADGNNGFETWVQGSYSKSITVSQKVVAPASGYYYLTAKARCDGSSPSLTDPKLYDAHLFTMVGSNPERTSKKLAEMPGLVTSGAWNTKEAWRTLSMAFTANAGDTIKLGIASTSFMQMDNFTLAYRGNNNPATIDVAYITKVKVMDALADSVQNDPVYRMLSKDTLLTVTLKAITDVSATATFDQSIYDAIVIQESMGGGDAIFFPAGALGLSKLTVPTLYNKTYAFKAARALVAPAAGAATGAEAPAGIYALKVDSANKANPLFRGITFVADTVQMFTKAAQDNGAAPTTVANAKALNVANAVPGTEGTLLAYPTGMTTTLCINDILAGDTIGGQALKARIITFGLNYGAQCRDNGKNMTNANYTLWRNAVYSLVGLTIPNTPMVVVAIEKPAVANDMKVVVYPNPTTSNINISNLNLNSTVKIYNMTGQQVFNGKANSDVMTVDMSRYSNGIYMLQVVSNGKSMKSKIIKK